MTLRPTDPGVRVAIGVSGSGKSHGLKRDAREGARLGMRVLVIDPMAEWTARAADYERRVREKSADPAEWTPAHDGARYLNVPRALSLTTRVVAGSDMDKARAAFKANARLVIMQPEESDVQPLAEAAASWALEKREQGVRGLYIHEAWLALPSSGLLPDSLAMVSRAWRHRGVVAGYDAQRIASLSRQVVDIAQEVRLYPATGDRDFSVINDIGGKELVAAVRDCADRFDKGETGWHVVLSASRRPPYIPVRG